MPMPITDANAPEYKRLCWHSRRGMLELDLVLEPFVRDVYLTLDAADQRRYQRLLECQDQELFGWFLRRETPADADHARMVGMILAHNEHV